jgi:putative folate metabolism gamma-glutamate ligase
MIVKAYKTEPIRGGDSLYHILDKYLPKLEEKDVLVITSKIISITQGRIVALDENVDKYELIRKESSYYLSHIASPSYGFLLTIVNNILIPNAGIDESNGNGCYVLWPAALQETTNDIWKYIRKKYQLTHLGIIISDSHTTMLRWGVTGVALAWCGFLPLYRYIGKPDIFGRIFHSTNASVIDSLAASAVSVMGEGSEQTPLAVIKEAHNVQFQDHTPTKEEIYSLKINLKDDLYAPLLTAVKWNKGGKS